MKTKKVRILTGIPALLGREGAYFPVFCAVGQPPTTGEKRRIEVQLFANWNEAVKAGQGMLFRHYVNVSVGRADHLPTE